jgi:hypothetical protein
MAESAWRKAVEAAMKAYRSALPTDGHPETRHVNGVNAAITAFLASARESGADIPKIEGEPT